MLQVRNIFRGNILRSRGSIDLLAQRSRKQRKQVQPASGPDRAFGQALREIREAKKISQERLALEGGVDRTYISLIERGINSPTIRMVVAIAEVLKVPPSKIVRRMEERLSSAKTEHS